MKADKTNSETSLNTGTILIDSCVDGLSKSFSEARLPEGWRVKRAKNSFSETDEMCFMPNFLKQQERVLVVTSDKNDFNSFVSPKCCVVTFSNGNIEAPLQEDLIKRLFTNKPFRSLNNLFSIGRIVIEKCGRVNYKRFGRPISKILRSPHLHNHKPFTLVIKK